MSLQYNVVKTEVEAEFKSTQRFPPLVGIFLKMAEVGHLKKCCFKHFNMSFKKCQCFIFHIVYSIYDNIKADLNCQKIL